jgi:multiple sugar transport system permease protein
MDRHRYLIRIGELEVPGKSRLFLFFSLAPAFTFILVFGIFPFVFACFYSARSFYLGLNVTDIFTAMTNYHTSVIDPLFQYSMGLTVLFVIVSVGLQLLIGVGSAILFSVIKTRAYKYIQVFLTLPLMMPGVVTGFLWWYLFNTDLGIVNYYLSFFGLMARNVNLLANRWTALGAIIYADVWMWTPFIMIVTYAAIQSIPSDVMEAALVDGAKDRHMIRKIILPRISTALLVVLLIRVIDAFRTYDLVYVLTGGGPGTTTQVASLEIYNTAFISWFLGKSFAQALILTAILILVGNILIYFLRRGS